MRFTVFTPTYNRAYRISEVYHSLQRQTFKDFEWIVVDDGSTDDTEKLFHTILAEENFFPIKYLKVNNGGKHRAFNKAVQIAAGEIFICCDSDDYLTDDCLEAADQVENTIPYNEKKQFAGICGLKGSSLNTAIGTTFCGNKYLDATALERDKYNISGDRSEFIYTDVWRKYPFVEFEGENFLTEYTALSVMAVDGLKFRYFNHIVKIIEYLPDGLTANGRKRFEENPKGWGLYLHQLMKNGQLHGEWKRARIVDYYFSCRGKMPVLQIAKNLHMSVIEFMAVIAISGIEIKTKRLLHI